MTLRSIASIRLMGATQSRNERVRASGLFRLVILLAAVPALSGCSFNAVIEELADDEKERIAQDYIERLTAGDVATLVEELDPALRTGSEQSQLEAMRGMFPEHAPTVSNLVGYQVSKSLRSSDTYNLTYQFGYDEQWLLVNAAWRELADGKRRIIGLNARPLAQSLQTANAFSFKRSGLRYYVMLAAAVVVPLFVLTTLVVCVRTKFPKRKWVWILLVSFGIVQVSINWTTGDMSITPIAILLFGASATASSVYSPWIISVSAPLGAALFWVRRNKLKVDGTAHQPIFPEG